MIEIVEGTLLRVCTECDSHLFIKIGSFKCRPKCTQLFHVLISDGLAVRASDIATYINIANSVRMCNIALHIGTVRAHAKQINKTLLDELCSLTRSVYT